MSRAEIAKQNFLSGMNCAQSVLLAFSDITQLSQDDAIKIAAPFGGGLARMRYTCGAINGMAMAAGLIFARSDATPAEKNDHYALIQQLVTKFKDQNGSIICRELLTGIEVTTTPDAESRTAQYYKKRPCADYVYDAAAILEDLCDNK